MKPIWQAVERAKAESTPHETKHQPIPKPSSPIPGTLGQDRRPEPVLTRPKIDLDRRRLQTNRIVAHDAKDPRSKAFDILRTQVLQAMDHENWKILAATSPRASCGKTVTAINLALSISRLPERGVLLVDLDLQKPKLATCLGLNCKHGVVGILEGRVALQDALIETRIGNNRVLVLPAETRVIDSSELMASRAMRTMLQDIRRQFESHIIVLDLPPMLVADDVLALLPQVDCVLLVAAVGSSTVSEIQQCNKHLQSTPLVRLVLTKSREPDGDYYY